MRTNASQSQMLTILVWINVVVILANACPLRKSTLVDGHLCHPKCTGRLSVLLQSNDSMPDSSYPKFDSYDQLDSLAADAQYKDCRCFCLRKYSGTKIWMHVQMSARNGRTVPFEHIAPIDHLDAEFTAIWLVGDGENSKVSMSEGSFSKMTSLQYFHVWYFRVKNIPSNFLPPRLKKISALGMGFNVRIPKAFFQISIVNTLHYHHNGLIKFPKASEIPESWKNIDDLSLVGNELTAFPNGIFALKKIVTLDLTENNIGNVALTFKEKDMLFNLKTFKHTIESNYSTTCPGGSIATIDLSPSFQICLNDQSKVTTLPVIGEGNNKSTPPLKTSLTQHPLPQKINTNQLEGKADKQNNSTHWLLIAIIVLSTLIIILLLAALSARCYRKKLAIGIDDIYQDCNPTEKHPGTKSKQIFNDPDLNRFRIPFDSIALRKRVATGSAGEVWLGYYEMRKVAVKRLITSKSSDHQIENFINEIKLIARLEHPKIVRFIGCAWQTKFDLQAVTEFMDCSDLRTVLTGVSGETLSWQNEKLHIAMDIVEALNYLHSRMPVIIHRDLKSRNIMMDTWAGAKLSDFGISKTQSIEESLTSCIGTVRWMAPEVMSGDHYNESADIFSFGVVLSELDTHKLPYESRKKNCFAHEIQIMNEVAVGKLKPSFSKLCPDFIHQLANRCLQHDPTLRPSAKEIFDILNCKKL